MCDPRSCCVVKLCYIHFLPKLQLPVFSKKKYLDLMGMLDRYKYRGERIGRITGMVMDGKSYVMDFFVPIKGRMFLSACAAKARLEPRFLPRYDTKEAKQEKDTD